MPTRLDDRVLSDALTRLAGWSGDAARIHREFPLDAVARPRLAADIEALADRTGHPIDVRATDEGFDVTLATDDVAGVSEVDIALAARLNDLFLGSPERSIPQQRQAHLYTDVPAAPADVPADVSADASADVPSEEREWWADQDRLEPLMGVPATTSGVMPAPLPDTAPDEPEPGIEAAQEGGAGDGLGFLLRGPGDPPE